LPLAVTNPLQGFTAGSVTVYRADLQTTPAARAKDLKTADDLVDRANKLQQSGATSSDVPMLPERVSPPPRRLLLDANLLGTRATR